MAAYPPGGTFLDGKKSFSEVPIENSKGNGIPTGPFLDACGTLVALFNVLESVIFKTVKADIEGNIKKIRERQLAAPLDSETLQDLVRNELKTKKHTATEGLVWLFRGLDFTAQALRRNIDQPNEELAQSFREAYGTTLKPHHSFVVKPIFSAAMSATPYRKDFYAKLGDDQTLVNKEMNTWVAALEERLAILREFLSSKEAKY